MSVESGDFISNLDKLWPLSGDPVNEGDDHLRLIKRVLISQFPGENGNGFSSAVAATVTELNTLSGATGNMQGQLNAIDSRVTANESAITNLQESLSAPVDTKMAFHQSAAPLGWVQDVALNDYMLRVVSGQGGGSAGSTSPTSMQHSHVTRSHTLTVTEMPSHSHTITSDSSTIGSEMAASTDFSGNSTQVVTNSTGGNASHTHGDTFDGIVDVRYTDMILCTKT